jgi:hypothetical protein
MGATLVGSKLGVFHPMPWPSEAHDAPDAVSDVSKESIFHVLEIVWAFRVFGAFRVLRDTLSVCKSGIFHTLPVATVDSGQIGIFHTLPVATVDSGQIAPVVP